MVVLCGWLATEAKATPAPITGTPAAATISPRHPQWRDFHFPARPFQGWVASAFGTVTFPP
jgi:hypothetical protein